MNPQVAKNLLQKFKQSLTPPFLDGFQSWAEQNIVLPEAYARPGKLNLSDSPYLIDVAKAIDDPHIVQVNFPAATQIGKSLLQELFVPYSVINCPGPIFRVFHSQDVSDVFAETRLIPLLRSCPAIKPLLEHDRFSTRKSAIVLPHVAVNLTSCNTALQHGMSVRYLLCDELHQWPFGVFDKFLARTTAFAGRRKILCASQPCLAGSEWESICNRGWVYEWSWLCPSCQHRQVYIWSKEKPSGAYAGMNWDTILNADNDSTNIELSAETAWLECENCDHRVHDTPSEREQLNRDGSYICTKNSGDTSVVTFQAPGFVNVNIPFKEVARAYLLAKQVKRTTGIDEDLYNFTTQRLGRFYKREQVIDVSTILTEIYEKELPGEEWIPVMGVDVQRSGSIKYYVVRAWKKDGTESRRLDFGVTQSWEEIEALRVKWKTLEPGVHVDSGDGENTIQIYQECIRHGRVIKSSAGLKWFCWTATKGDGQKTQYKHADNVSRYYSPESPQDPQFPMGHKLNGIKAGVVLFSNYSLKTILANLRDNKVPNVRWLIDRPDEVYDKQLYSEGLFDVIDKRSGVVVKRWQQRYKDNHYLDCEALCLLGALRANCLLSVGNPTIPPAPEPAELKTS